MKPIEENSRNVPKDAPGVLAALAILADAGKDLRVIYAKCARRGPQALQGQWGQRVHKAPKAMRVLADRQALWGQWGRKAPLVMWVLADRQALWDQQVHKAQNGSQAHMI